MTMTVEKAQLNNQRILQNFGLGEEIDEQAAEIISGGGKRFTITNNTTSLMIYSLDDAVYFIDTGKTQNFYTDYNGKMSFDKDIREPEINVQKECLKDGKAYQFKPNAGNSNLIDLVLV